MIVDKLSDSAEELNWDWDWDWDWNSNSLFIRWKPEKFCCLSSHFALFNVPFALLTT